MFAQPVTQRVSPVGHAPAQAPDTQRPSAPHALPHDPQFAASMLVFTHASPQRVRPSMHVARAQTPAAQRVPVVHGVLHAPQCASSARASTQAPAHRVCPAGHAHAPSTHDCPAAHAWPHSPQFRALRAVDVLQPLLVSPSQSPVDGAQSMVQPPS